MFKNAYTYMFKDKEIAKKAGSFLLLSVLCLLLVVALVIVWGVMASGKLASDFAPTMLVFSLVLVLLFVVVCLVLCGYSFACARAVMNQEQEEFPTLPFITTKSLSFGLKSFIAAMPYTLLSIVGFVLFFASFVFEKSNPLAPVISMAVFLLVYFVAAVLFLILSPVLTYIFARTEGLASFLRFPTAIKIIKHNLKKYFAIVGLLFVNNIVTNTVSQFSGAFVQVLVSFAILAFKGLSLQNLIILSTIGCLILILLFLPAFVVSTYTLYSGAYLIGKMLTTEEFEKITAKVNASGGEDF